MNTHWRLNAIKAPPNYANSGIGPDVMEAENMTNDDIEKEIQSKGLTAPRVTMDSINAKVRSEFYFTAANGVAGAAVVSDLDPAPNGDDGAEALLLLTFCVLVLENGFTVTGTAGVASPENFDAEIGRKVARANAVASIWPLEGYLLHDRLYYESRLLAEQERRDEGR